MSRRRQTRTDRWFKALALLSIFIALVLSAIIAPLTGKGFSFRTFIIVFFVSLVVLLTLCIILSLPSVKGRIGERRVQGKLRALQRQYGGAVFHNVMVMDENGRTSQIDHIYVCSNGVFVIEVKNYAGRIYGTDAQQEWTQVLSFGHTKNHFYNPVKQNWTHIYRLRERIGKETTMFNVVIFVQGNVSYLESELAIGLQDIKHLMEFYPDPLLSDDEVERYAAAIQDLVDHPGRTTKEHVQEIKLRQKEIKSGICPRCGGTLVVRKSKKTGQEFLGCSNYPNCQFTKKID